MTVPRDDQAQLAMQLSKAEIAIPWICHTVIFNYPIWFMLSLSFPSNDFFSWCDIPPVNSGINEKCESRSQHHMCNQWEWNRHYRAMANSWQQSCHTNSLPRTRRTPTKSMAVAPLASCTHFHPRCALRVRISSAILPCLVVIRPTVTSENLVSFPGKLTNGCQPVRRKFTYGYCRNRNLAEFPGILGLPLGYNQIKLS
jgi:hypothetical protein